jgi:hypothetical protein
VVHLVHLISGEWRWTTHGLGRSSLHLAPLTAGRGSQFLGLTLSGGEFYHQDSLCLEHGLVSWRNVRLDRGSGLLAGELASPWCCLWLGGGLLSTGLHLLPPLMSVTLLKWEASVRPWHHHPWWNRHHGLTGRSILHPWCGCDGSGRSPYAAPPGRGEAEGPLPAPCHEELLDGILYHGPPWGWCPAASRAHEGSARVTPPGGEAQATEVVDDELEAPKENAFT